MDKIMTNPPASYKARGIALYTSEVITRIDRRRRTVQSAAKREVPYDRLLLATGSKSFVIPVPLTKLDGVITFRDIGDVNALPSAA